MSEIGEIIKKKSVCFFIKFLVRVVNRGGYNPSCLLQPSMCDWPYMLRVNLPLDDTIHSKGNKAVTGVKSKAADDSNLMIALLVVPE